jgi:glucose dehydrogenase
VHHDLWDYDNSGAPVLADITFRGQPRRILVHAGKTGFYTSSIAPAARR